MPQINQASIEKIYSMLYMKPFKPSDFDVVFPEKDEVYVKVTFRPEPQFIFKISEGRHRSDDLIGTITALSAKLMPSTFEVPGDFKTSNYRSHESFDDCISRISIWCSNIHAELKARVPVMNEFDELKKKLEEHINFHFENAEKRFSTAEIDDLSNKLNELYDKFAELQEQYALTEEELKEVKSELNELKSLAKDYSKGMWSKVAKSRVVSVITKIVTSKESRGLLVEGIKKFLDWS